MVNENVNENKVYRVGAGGPEKVFRAGSVKASVWANERNVNGKMVTMRSVSVSRNYRDQAGVWKTTNSYSAKELQDLRLVAQQAYEFLVAPQVSEADNSVVEEEVDIPAYAGPSSSGRVQCAFEGVQLVS